VLHDPPLALFWSGARPDAVDPPAPAAAIVGARKASDAGLLLAQRLAGAVAEATLGTASAAPGAAGAIRSVSLQDGGKTLVLAITQTTVQLDPAIAGSNGYGDIIPINENLYEGLTRYKNGSAEIEPALRNVQADGGPEQQGAGVGVAVGPLVRGRSRARLEVVVAILRIRWRPAPQRLHEILEQERLVLVHQHGGARVAALHRGHPLADPGPPDPLLHQLREIDELQGPFRAQPHQVPADAHGGPLLHAHEQARCHSSPPLGSLGKVGWRSGKEVTGM